VCSIYFHVRGRSLSRIFPFTLEKRREEKKDEIGLFLQYRGRKLPLLPDPGIAFGGREITGLKKILVVYISHTI